MLTSSHSTILCPCIALPFPLEGVSAPAFGPPLSLGAVAPGIALSCSTLTRKQIRWHARGYLKARSASAHGCINQKTVFVRVRIISQLPQARQNDPFKKNSTCSWTSVTRRALQIPENLETCSDTGTIHHHSVVPTLRALTRRGTCP